MADKDGHEKASATTKVHTTRLFSAHWKGRMGLPAQNAEFWSLKLGESAKSSQQ